MKCLVCGMEMPEGTTVCTNCRTESEQKESNTIVRIGWNPDGTALYGERKELLGKYRETIKPLRRLYICELILVCISSLALVLNVVIFWPMIGYLDGNMDNYERITSLVGILEKYLWIAVPVVIVFMVVMAVSFYRMKYYESRFHAVLCAGAIMLALRFLAQMFSDRSGLAQALSLALIIASWTYYFFFFQAFEKYMKQGFPKMSKTLGWFQAVYPTFYLVPGICRLIQVSVSHSNSVSSEWMYIMGTSGMVSRERNILIASHVESWITFVLLVLEVWMLRKIYKLCTSATGRQSNDN